MRAVGQLLGDGVLDESLDFLDYGYKELSIPARDGEFALHALIREFAQSRVPDRLRPAVEDANLVP